MWQTTSAATSSPTLFLECSTCRTIGTHDDAQDFCSWLSSKEAPALKQVSFSVCALGDKWLTVDLLYSHRISFRPLTHQHAAHLLAHPLVLCTSSSSLGNRGQHNHHNINLQLVCGSLLSADTHLAGAREIEAQTMQITSAAANPSATGTLEQNVGCQAG